MHMWFAVSGRGSEKVFMMAKLHDIERKMKICLK